MRRFWTLIHRWAGLSIAAFLIVAGLTGSVIAFYHELDSLLNPSLYRAVPPAPGAAPLDPVELRAQLLKKVPGTRLNYVELDGEPGEAVVYYVQAGDGAQPLENDEVFLDPYTGAVKGARKWGDITQGWDNLVPFLYRLHYELALGTFGIWVMGLAALVWTIDCFIGFYLTLPARRGARQARTRPARGWWSRWKPAWQIKASASRYRINFDLHRAGGLWLWAMLFVLAWSSVALNLGTQVYNPVMTLAFDMRTQSDAIPARTEPLHDPPIGFARAREIGYRHMLAQARKQGFEAGTPRHLSYDPNKGIYRYGFTSDTDILDDGSSYLMFSGEDGRYLAIYLPDRESAGEQITIWIVGLHMAKIGGLLMQIFICFMGFVTIMLCVTGIVIWWKKRKARIGRNDTKRARGHMTAEPNPRNSRLRSR